MMIALQKERTRLSFIAIKSAAGRPRDFDVVVVNLAIANHRNATSDEGDVNEVHLPRPSSAPAGGG